MDETGIRGSFELYEGDSLEAGDWKIALNKTDIVTIRLHARLYGFARMDMLNDGKIVSRRVVIGAWWK